MELRQSIKIFLIIITFKYFLHTLRKLFCYLIYIILSIFIFIFTLFSAYRYFCNLCKIHILITASEVWFWHHILICKTEIFFSVITDNYMIQQWNIHKSAYLCHSSCYLDIFPAGRNILAWVVMYHHHGSCIGQYC